MEKKRIWLFIALSFGLTWGLILLCTQLGMPYGSPASSLWLMGCMLLPAISSLLTRLLTREGFRNMGFALGWRQGGWKAYLLAYLGPSLCMLFGAAVYFLLFPSRFDPGATLLMDTLEAQGLPREMALLTLGIQVITGLLLGPLVNVPFTLGEELGWRAYLLPKLAGLYGRRKALLLSGLIWGLWHGPMIALGHNYGLGYWGYPVSGILAMVVFCLCAGAAEGYLTFRTGSVWPAAIFHSGMNAIAALPAYFAAGENSPFIGPMMTGILGGSGLLLLGLWAFIRCGKVHSHAPEGNL